MYVQVSPWMGGAPSSLVHTGGRVANLYLDLFCVHEIMITNQFMIFGSSYTFQAMEIRAAGISQCCVFVFQ